ncbi:hypothetical protein GCM10010357_41250 [Streptomyces luteireticuli]|uniref:Beta-ketoacyl synthase C-terminal domain-containing protein n=1 Tax=Streptomyces luteireticuli TaxID=173858 RepID=A0ABP3IQF6_9ACTN
MKSNVGHPEAASGMAGLVKALLVLRHRRIPATPHAEELNPRIPGLTAQRRRGPQAFTRRLVSETRQIRPRTQRSTPGGRFAFGGECCRVGVVTMSQDVTTTGARALAPDEYGRAYDRLTAVAVRNGARLGADVAHQALTEALAAVGVLAPAFEPESEACTVRQRADTVMWLLGSDEGIRHGGFVLGRLADGAIPAFASGHVQYERRFTDSSTAHGGAWGGPVDGAPAEQPMALVPGCVCGWRGPDLLYDPAGGLCGNGTCHNGQAVHAHRLWQEHATAELPAEGSGAA